MPVVFGRQAERRIGALRYGGEILVEKCYI
jgi:hypothetical protein